MITIATWNVNSVKARLEHLLGWLRDDAPDIVLLQELKCVDDAFPTMEIEELGYNIAVHGQKTYNGVAILSKFPLSDIQKGLPGEPEPEQARYIEAVVSVPCHPERSEGSLSAAGDSSPPAQNDKYTALRVASVYVVNGQEVGSDKYAHKLAFLKTLDAHLHTLLGYEEHTIIGGDFNIAPNDVDVHDPKQWAGSVLTHDEVRAAWRRIVYRGWQDACEVAGKITPAEYTWWDYRGGAHAKDQGLRIDHLLLSPEAAQKLQNYEVVKKLRDLEKASDHAPVRVVIHL